MTPHFSDREMTCRCGCGQQKMNELFMDRLELIRNHLNHLMIVNSGYRCQQHNCVVSVTGVTGPHTTGHAVDVMVYGSWCYKLIKIALEMGMTGIGIYQKGPWKDRFVHLDDLTDTNYPRPRIWSY